MLNLVNYYFIVDKVEAIYDVWLIGDEFFSKIYDSLKEWRCRTRAAKSKQPYLYDYYNVFGYYMLRSSGNRYAIGRVLNSLIVGLNTRHRLPRLIILILDKDVIEDVGIYHDSHAAVQVMAENIGWLFQQMEILIKRK